MRESQVRNVKIFERVAARIEEAEALDAFADAAASALRRVIRPGVVEDTLSGVPGGHPLHPAAVVLPLGAWASAGLLDAVGEDDAARRLVAAGLVAAMPAAASGASDWLNTAGAERRVGLVHAMINYGAIGAYGLSWWARRRGATRTGVGLSVFGAGLLSAAGWLGGHLTYAQGVGVDTTAFQGFPADWLNVAPESDAPEEGAISAVDAGGVPLLLARVDNALTAMADRCTHRGAPLHEGEVANGCVTCPWHGSVISLDDGALMSGPAVRPQPTLAVRIRDGRIEVRRSETRTLRTNPAGH